MAIVEQTFYGLRCDGCGKMLLGEWDEDAYYDSEQYTEDVAIESGWMKVRDKHYCEDCHHYGDDNELVLGDVTVIQQDEDDWI